MANCSAQLEAVKTKQAELNSLQAKLNLAQEAVNAAKQQLDIAINNLIHCMEGPIPPKPL